jgi:hypothetical protein
MANKASHIALGVACAERCIALDRGITDRQEDELSRSGLEDIGRRLRE